MDASEWPKSSTLVNVWLNRLEKSWVSSANYRNILRFIVEVRVEKEPPSARFISLSMDEKVGPVYPSLGYLSGD